MFIIQTILHDILYYNYMNIIAFGSETTKQIFK